MNIKSLHIGIIGLGYVGLPLAVEFGKLTNVSGYDKNFELINSLKNGNDLNNEISSEQLCSAHSIEFFSNINDLESCNVYIVCVPTPVDENKVPNLEHLIQACERIGPLISDDDIVIFESTVFPGATDSICIPKLEKFSGKLCWTEGAGDMVNKFHVGYSPERINPGDKGRKIADIIKITSGSSVIAQKRIKQLYETIIKAGVYDARSIIVAETAKVIENIQRDVNIALMNEFSNFCYKLNIDTREVICAAQTKWNFLQFTPGLVGGHCIGVDPYYLTNLAQKRNCDVDLITTARLINEAFPAQIARRLITALIKNKILPQNAEVIILGVTFKENVTDIRNSKVKELIDELESWGVKVFAHDPTVPIEIIEENFTNNVLSTYVNSSFDGIIVAVGHDEFKAITPQN